MSAQTGRRAAATPERILDVAEGLLQARGYNGFSYADIAEAVGITKASIAYLVGKKLYDNTQCFRLVTTGIAAKL